MLFEILLAACRLKVAQLLSGLSNPLFCCRYQEQASLFAIFAHSFAARVEVCQHQFGASIFFADRIPQEARRKKRRGRDPIMDAEQRMKRMRPIELARTIPPKRVRAAER